MKTLKRNITKILNYNQFNNNNKNSKNVDRRKVKENKNSILQYDYKIKPFTKMPFTVSAFLNV
jgi:hypothetical protein